jgi:uncharacterized protein (TIGR02996 family)
MSDRDARSFLEAICANPDDDTSRLVYADYLAEHGHEERAEFIRLQIERAALPEWDGRWFTLSVREKALLARHEQEWREELPDIRGVVWGEYRRGFVASARLVDVGLRERFPAVTPIEALEVPWPQPLDPGWYDDPVPGLRELVLDGHVYDRDDVDRLADSPVLSTLRALTIRNAGLQSNGFHSLIGSPHLRGLKVLRVPNNSIGNRGAEALVECDTLPNLEELDVSEENYYGRYAEDPVIDARGVAHLAEWPGLARLRTLVLAGNELQQSGLHALLQSPHTSGLKNLIIRGAALTGAALREFGTAQKGLALESLDLSDNLLRDAGAGHLARAACLRTLKALYVGRCELGPVGADKLAKARFFGGLRILSADYNNFGPEGLSALLGVKPAALHSLLLAGNDIGDAGVGVLATSPASDNLLNVDLAANDLGAGSARLLGATGHLRNLRVLRVTNNPLDKRSRDALAASPLGKRLTSLEMYPSDDDPIPF